ncbi:MAG: sulfite exporter TauE/SafE family protein, partial [Acidobacteria bacterium]|nr:sulfite exporter TauE/SafE family protein [Acidobacteriota bacterium]
MPPIDAAHEPLTIVVSMVAGAVAGSLGALLGIGGGVFLIPLLNLGLGLPLKTASGISLMTVIATSNAVATSSAARRVINLRLGMLLQIVAVGGGLLGALVLPRIATATLYIIFASVTAVIAVVMLTRIDKRNVILDSSIDPGSLGGRFYEEESGREVVYKVRRLPAALGVSLIGGVVSGLLGIGGGILQVPALIAWCGVPIRAAAATTAAMIGITALGSAPIYYARGHVSATLAAAAVLGVLFGS